MSEKIDFVKVTRMCTEILDQVKSVALMFPKDKEFLLKHMAAVSIHLAFFSRDLVNHVEEGLLPLADGEEEFLNKCGCKDE